MKNIKILFVTVVLIISICIPVYATPVRGVNSWSNLTIAQLQQLTYGTKLSGYEQLILDLERQYQINAFFIIAVAKVETAGGNAGVGQSKNNLYGMRGSNGFYYYSNAGESTKAFCDTISTLYFANGRYSLSAIAEWYCNSHWGYKVEDMINDLYYQVV